MERCIKSELSQFRIRTSRSELGSTSFVPSAVLAEPNRNDSYHFRTRNRKIKTNVQVKNDGLEIKEMTKTKFLGVIINNLLTWSDHIEMVKDKVSTNIGIISRMCYYVTKTVLLSLYHSLVEPYLQCCNVVWAVHRSTSLSALFIFQKKSYTNCN